MLTTVLLLPRMFALQDASTATALTQQILNNAYFIPASQAPAALRPNRLRSTRPVP
jgi:hypothetical protein